MQSLTESNYLQNKTYPITVAAVRKEYARRSHEASEEWKQQMHRAEMTLEENDQTYKAVGAGIDWMCIGKFSR